MLRVEDNITKINYTLHIYQLDYNDLNQETIEDVDDVINEGDAGIVIQARR